MTSGERKAALAALEGLLEEFRRGHIVSRPSERRGMEQHAGALTEQWDERHPSFPKQYFPYTSFRGENYRGRRDAYLKDIIVQALADQGSAATTIVNPACVFGRHAVDLASRLPHVKVIGTDIDPHWDWYYRQWRRGRRLPDNYTFVKDDIFESQLEAQPTAVVFFGACGAVSDGAIDYAIDSNAAHLMCRTCCHDNIGGNLVIARRPNGVNLFFRLKNWAYGGMKRCPKYGGYYFSEKYTRRAYPRSATARDVITSDELQAVARHSAESDICRTIIDLDRYLHLVESGFHVLYQGELFVAERTA